MNATRDSNLASVAARIAEGRRPLLIGHVRADADCIGALAAMALALHQAGKQPTVAVQRALVPPRLLLLCEWAGVDPVETPDVSQADLVVVLDTAVTSRLNIACGIDGLAGLPMVAIDHHVTNERFAALNYVDAGASSTCELVFDLLTHLGWPIVPMVATLLYAGIHADTERLSLASVTPKTLQVMSELVSAGARIAEVCQRTLRSRTRSEFDLHRLIYDNTCLSEDGRVAWSTAGHDEIIATGCNHADIADQVSIPRSLDGADIAILFSEGMPSSVRINFRSEGDVDVLALAREFGGGGHPNAAGTSVKNKPLDRVVEEVVGRAVAYLAERYPC